MSGPVGRRARGWRRLTAAGVAALLAGGCGDGGSTELGSPPAAIVALSMPVDTVVTGERTDPPVSVRVEDALGNPVEGAPVRFIVARGGGSLSPGVAVSARDGIAESVYRAGPTPGEATIRVDIPSASNVAALEFLVLAEAADSVVLSVVEGSGQRAEAGSQLPLPFVVEARTSRGGTAGGVRIDWRLAAGAGQSPILTSRSVLTGSDGRGRTVLTLGRTAREYRVEAFAAGGVHSDTVRFTATATATFEGSLALDSVGAGGLVAGGQATLYGRGFSPLPSENDVRIEGEPARILAASVDQLMIEVPGFAGQCLPTREVGVRVLAGGEASNGRLVPLRPAETLIELAVGEAMRLHGPQATACLQLPPSDRPREYRLMIGSVARTPGARTPVRVSARVPSSLSERRGAGSVVRRELDPNLESAALERGGPGVRIRTQALQTLARGRVSVSRAAAAATLRVPALGDTLEYRFPVGSDLAATCADTTQRVRGVVRALGQRLALVSDVSSPRVLSAEEWTALGAELDRTVAVVDSAYFGPWADIDGNGRVLVLFTPKVNALSSGAGGIGGFFLPLDLAASGRGGGGVPGSGGEICPASNEAELLYVVAADPDGQFGPVIDKARALRNARGLVAHELAHLINAQTRVLRAPAGFAAAEEVWLDEAIASLAEEVVGLASAGLGVRGDYSFGQVASTRQDLDAFNAFHLSNFLNLSLYMFDPARAPTIAAADPGGLGGLQMRGFGWFLLRWLADQRGGDERTLFRSLVDGGQNFATGIANIERVTGRAWNEILADFSVMLATDDAGIEQLPARFQVTTWNFRDIFVGLNRNTSARTLFPIPFPLQATPLAFETGALEFDVGASSVRYFALASGLDAPAMAIALSTPSGAQLSESAEPQITIVRTR